MKKSGMVVGGAMLAFLTGYGAWCWFKKMNPECSKDIEKSMKDMTRNMKKNIEDMM